MLAIAPHPGTYASGTPISIASAEPGAEIFYTLDGSPPSPASKHYRGPIRLGAETTANGTLRLRAIAVRPNGRISPVASASFERTPGLSIRFRKPDVWSSASVHYWETEPDGLATLWPGQEMSADTDGWYGVELPGQTAANLVFSDAGSAQTGDLRADAPDTWFDGEDRWAVDPVRFSRFLFPGGAAKALVLSMDDGPLQDRRLIEILDRYGLRGTFHLNSGRLGAAGHVGAGEVASLYAGHEVSTHSVTHPYLDSLSRAGIAVEVDRDRAVLSRITGRAARGHAYPFGAHDARVIEVLQALGIAYARTAAQTLGFRLPSDLLRWNPSCHHSAAAELIDAFIDLPDSILALFFIYGHSWELDAGEPTNSWAYMESIARRLGGRDDIWYATAIEVADYVRALCSATPSLADDGLHNPTETELWMRGGESVVRLRPGASLDRLWRLRMAGHHLSTSNRRRRA